MSSSGVSITNLGKEMKHVKDKKEVGQLDMVGVRKDTRGAAVRSQQKHLVTVDGETAVDYK